MQVLLKHNNSATIQPHCAQNITHFWLNNLILGPETQASELK